VHVNTISGTATTCNDLPPVGQVITAQQHQMQQPAFVSQQPRSKSGHMSSLIQTYAFPDLQSFYKPVLLLKGTESLSLSAVDPFPVVPST